MKKKERSKIFADVYENNRWGRSRNGLKYYSDSPPELTKPYRDFVSNFIKQNDVRKIVDLGCGDFEASSGIDMGDAHYIGVDIYEHLVYFDNQNYKDKFHEFIVCDIVQDDLPDGDLCLITLVLYLLSYDDIFAILRKLSKYRFVLITDGQPNIHASQRHNVDKPTNGFTRSYHGNGFYLELAPFCLNISVVHQYQTPEGYNSSGEIVRTVLLENPL